MRGLRRAFGESYVCVGALADDLALDVVEPANPIYRVPSDGRRSPLEPNLLRDRCRQARRRRALRRHLRAAGPRPRVAEGSRRLPRRRRRRRTGRPLARPRPPAGGDDRQGRRTDSPPAYPSRTRSDEFSRPPGSPCLPWLERRRQTGTRHPPPDGHAAGGEPALVARLRLRGAERWSPVPHSVHARRLQP